MARQVLRSWVVLELEFTKDADGNICALLIHTRKVPGHGSLPSDKGEAKDNGKGVGRQLALSGSN